MMYLRKTTFLLIVLLFGGCGVNDFDRSLILENAANNLIIPAYQDFSSKTKALHTKVSAFTASPDSTSLKEAQQAWLEGKKSWKRAELYNFGPVQDLLLATAIDRWPVNEDGIESAVNEYDDSENYLTRIGSNRKGLPAIEYLLFHKDSERVLNEFSDPNRKTYINLLTAALKDHITKIINEWNNSYKQEFVSSTDNTAMAGITLLTNKMIEVIERVHKEKVSIPFGEQTLGDPRLHTLESQYAHASKAFIRENLVQAQHTFNGGEGQGFDDYLNALGIEDDTGVSLAGAINSEFDNSLQAIHSMDGSLREAILHEKPKVKQLIESTQQLILLTKVDMTAQLSLMVTYSDNDGD